MTAHRDGCVLMMGLLLVLLVVVPAMAADPADPAEPRFRALRQQLVADGFDRQWIQTVYSNPDIRFDTVGARSYFRHREASLDYDQFTTDQSIAAARSYMETHRTALDTAERAYGVDREVITAILLVETRLGSYTGKRSIIGILSTLSALQEPAVRDAFWDEMPQTPQLSRAKFDRWADGKSKWAYRELKAFLTYVSEQGLAPAEIYGSYAGALGIAQFIPTSILSYARDGNADGKVNLFHHADAIASVGSYLKRNGWRADIDREGASKVIFRYNRSTYYVDAILAISDRLKS